MQDNTGRTIQVGQHRKDNAGRKIQAGQYRQDNTGRTIQAGSILHAVSPFNTFQKHDIILGNKAAYFNIGFTSPM